jgi:Fe-S oxidoreductase
MAPVANRMMKLGRVARLAKATAGIDQRRSIPAFAPKTLRKTTGVSDVVPDVWIWADSFTDRFAAETGRAAISLLETMGLRTAVIPEPACCGLTWITTGQLDTARELVGRAVEQLHPYVADGVPVVGLEPSCLSVLRSEAVELIDDPRAAEVAGGVLTLAELLTRTEGWSAPDLTGTEVVVQPHCHQASVMGFEADLALLEGTGATITRLAGCCGLAGNFGVEKGHYDVSVTIAEHQLLPAVRDAGPDAVVLADGFSCRTQLDDLAGVQAWHIAQLLARDVSR